MKAVSLRKTEFDGKEMTNYEASQVQRRLEREIRKQKNRSVIAASAGDDEMRREAQMKINQLTGKYKDLSDKFGIKTKAERMSVSGYWLVKVAEKALPKPRPQPTGFQSKRKAKQHAYQHALEFGLERDDVAGYEKLANEFFKRTDSNFEEFTRNPGKKGVADDTFRFDPNTLEFGIIRGDGSIRTFHHLRKLEDWENKKKQ